MKKAFYTSSLYLLCLVIITGFTVSQIANASVESKRDNGYISLNASKTVEVEPNMARISFAVENTAENAQTATKENNEISNKIINALKSITDSKTDVITTTNFSVYPIYSSTKEGKSVIKNYKAVNSVTVKTKNTQNVAKLIDTAIANGANRTDGLYFSFENDNSKCKEMYPQVMSSLKEQATSLANSAGTSIDGIKYISASCSVDSAYSGGRVYFAKSAMADNAAMAEESGSSTPVEAGKVKIRVNVNVDFYVK